MLFTIEHREHNKCLNWEMLHFYPLNELIYKMKWNKINEKNKKKNSWHRGIKGLKKQEILKSFSWENI